ncbi:putative glutathione S-transferase kappa 1 [Mycena sanguinolenta]|uniref:Glutathione S-transferase kappa n=1 Tax=Mycena sanguinolenta TaxID=230812 RepID=A0A8H7CA61_9AGAR|nr:putative glutathione S-transferase kappa 1 [Mycena sanguinolenta]
MAGHIDCYMDLLSLYSFLAFEYLLRRRDVLATHGVSIDFHPFFLGGIMKNAGNKPPWTVPAKKDYAHAFEDKRAKQYFGVPDLMNPPVFPILTLLPLRALCYIKATFPQSTSEQAWLAFFRAYWIPPHANIDDPDTVRDVLRDTKLFSDAEVDAICAAAQEKQWKDVLLENTTKVVEQGAFGAPWMWVRDASGKEEPFFGSDRFHFVWQYLGLPWKDMELLPREAKL